MDEVLHVFTRVNGLEDVFESPGNDPSLSLWLGNALHGERLAASGLAVGEHCSVVAFQDSFNQRIGDLVVYGFSGGVRVVDSVEGERLWRCTGIVYVDHRTLRYLGVHKHTRLRKTCQVIVIFI